MNLEKAKNIHFIGIGGIGLSAIAQLMKEKGKEVSGSDLNKSLVTKKLKKKGIKIFIGQNEKNISSRTEFVIHTTAIAKDNPELTRAKKMGIKTISYPESLGEIFNKKYGIAVCGTHGKSSTTSMIGLLLDRAKLDPTIIVGSIVPKYGSNLRMGKSKYMVIEACEYERAFLNYYPKVIVLNNIELDHTDYYKDINDFRSAFKEFVGRLPKDGVLIYNGDDGEVSSIKYQVSSKISFGLGENNDVKASDINFKNGKTRYKVFYKNSDLGEFVLKVPGIFNVYNSLAAISLGLVLDVSIGVIKKSLANYSGIWRRFEFRGKYKNAFVISDYAHHPTAVKLVIEAAKQFYSGKRIFAVFQPHQHNRTKKLYEDFLKSFDEADLAILAEIFDVAGREESEDRNVSSLDLVNDIKKQNGKIADNVFYAKDLKETRKLIDEKIKPNDILLIMGAGDIYKVADEIAQKKGSKAP